MIRLVAAVSLVACTPALALDLPVRGVFGTGSGGCRAFEQGEEGAYVAFNKDGTGEGGEGGCDFVRVQPAGPGRYALVGTCGPLEGKPARARVPLAVHGPDEVTYRGARYRRCPGQ